MKVLVVSTMFPSAANPVHAVFVRNRIQRVAERCDVRVLSPIPWFPFAVHLKRYQHRKGIPHHDVIGGLETRYPRFLSIPALFKPLDGVFLFLSVWWAARKLRKEFDFDLIDAHLAYPDGYGCALLAKWLKKPLLVTLRGHDVNDVPKYPVRRRQVQYALRTANRVIGVARALCRAAVDLGCDESKTTVVSNGVDGELFGLDDRVTARRALGLPEKRRIILGVGHLVERKGFHLLVDAVGRLHEAGLDDVYLVIVGGPGEEGDWRDVIRERIRANRLEDHVLLAGAQLNNTLRNWYNAADVFCLASEKEGWANVLLETLACGTPAVATNVWGTPEVVSSDDYGVLVERTPESIAEGLRRALEKNWDREAISRYALGHTWDRVADRVLENFHTALGRESTPREVEIQKR